MTKDKTGTTCRLVGMRKMRNFITILVKRLRGKRDVGNLDVNESIILKLILGRSDVRAWTTISWLRIE
jgi:hypothetical protein